MPLEILLVKKPYIIAFSGNPIHFAFALSPYGDNEKTQGIRAEISVLVEQNPGTNIFEVIKSQTFYPLADGMINIDVSSILDPYLLYYTPRLTLGQPVPLPDLPQAAIAPEQCKRYKIAFFAQKDLVPLAATQLTDAFYALKGGMAHSEWHPVNYFQQVLEQQHSFLAFSAPGEMTGMEETRFLAFLNYGTEQSLTAAYSIHLSNGSTAAGSSIFFDVPQWGIAYIPAGFNQASLHTHVPSGLLAVSYTVTIGFLSSFVFVSRASFTFYIDHRRFYETYQILYRNSLGGIETIRFRGQVDLEADYTSQQAQRTLPPSYYSDMLLLPQNISVPYNQETEKFKGDTGFLSKPALMKLRDLMLSTQRLQLIDGKLLPIQINLKNAKFYSNHDNLVSMQVDWEAAYTNSFYTPAGLFPAAPACPAIENLLVRQVDKNTLQVMYALQIPYDHVHLRITYAANGEQHDYYFTGNARTVFVSFELPEGLSYPQSISVAARTVCDQAINDYGSYTTVDTDVIGNQLPVVVDDSYSIAAGFTAAVTLAGSVLDNDYDPDNDDIEAVTSSGSTTAGGTYSINAAGVVQYTPPSAGYNGLDTFVYAVREVGQTTTVNGSVRIAVGAGLVPIFVRLMVLNQQSSSTGTTIKKTTVTGQVWMFFFSDPAGTNPISVTGLGLLINVDKHVDIVSDTPGTTVTSLQFAGSGQQTKIYDGEIKFTVSLLTLVTISRTTTFVAKPGTGYTVI